MSKRVYANLHSFFRENPQESAEQVARDVGCSYPHLSMIKWHHREPSLPLAIRIARRCNVPLESLVKDKAELEYAS